MMEEQDPLAPVKPVKPIVPVPETEPTPDEISQADRQSYSDKRLPTRQNIVDANDMSGSGDWGERRGFIGTKRDSAYVEFGQNVVGGLANALKSTMSTAEELGLARPGSSQYIQNWQNVNQQLDVFEGSTPFSSWGGFAGAAGNVVGYALPTIALGATLGELGAVAGATAKATQLLTRTATGTAIMSQFLGDDIKFFRDEVGMAPSKAFMFAGLSSIVKTGSEMMFGLESKINNMIGRHGVLNMLKQAGMNPALERAIASTSREAVLAKALGNARPYMSSLKGMGYTLVGENATEVFQQFVDDLNRNVFQDKAFHSFADYVQTFTQGIPGTLMLGAFGSYREHRNQQMMDELLNPNVTKEQIQLANKKYGPEVMQNFQKNLDGLRNVFIQMSQSDTRVSREDADRAADIIGAIAMKSAMMLDRHDGKNVNPNDYIDGFKVLIAQRNLTPQEVISLSKMPSSQAMDFMYERGIIDEVDRHQKNSDGEDTRYVREALRAQERIILDMAKSTPVDESRIKTWWNKREGAPKPVEPKEGEAQQPMGLTLVDDAEVRTRKVVASPNTVRVDQKGIVKVPDATLSEEAKVRAITNPMVFKEGESFYALRRVEDGTFALVPTKAMTTEEEAKARDEEKKRIKDKAQAEKNKRQPKIKVDDGAAVVEPEKATPAELQMFQGRIFTPEGNTLPNATHKQAGEVVNLIRQEQEQQAVEVNRDGRIKSLADIPRTGALEESGQRVLFQSGEESSDAAYMAAVESGDVAEQQRLVDEAAKAAGYNVKAFHGTPAGEFNEFETPSFLTTSEEEAKAYSFEAEKKYADALRTKYDEDTSTDARGKRVPYVGIPGDAKEGVLTATDNGVVLKSKGKITFFSMLAADEGTYSQNFDSVVLRESGARQSDVDEFRASAEDVAKRTESVSGVTGEIKPKVLRVYARIANPKEMSMLSGNRFGKRLGYDAEGKETTASLKAQGFDAVATKSDAGMMNHDAVGVDNYVVFDPSQIKSADPITRDDQGNVIPLSQRFNKSSPSILFQTTPDGTIELTEDATESVASRWFKNESKKEKKNAQDRMRRAFAQAFKAGEFTDQVGAEAWLSAYEESLKQVATKAGLYIPADTVAVFFSNADATTILHEFFHHVQNKNLLPSRLQNALNKSFGDIKNIDKRLEKEAEAFTRYLVNGDLPDGADPRLKEAFAQMRNIGIEAWSSIKNKWELPEDVKTELDNLFLGDNFDPSMEAVGEAVVASIEHERGVQFMGDPTKRGIHIAMKNFGEKSGMSKEAVRSALSDAGLPAYIFAKDDPTGQQQNDMNEDDMVSVMEFLTERSYRQQERAEVIRRFGDDQALSDAKELTDRLAQRPDSEQNWNDSLGGVAYVKALSGKIRRAAVKGLTKVATHWNMERVLDGGKENGPFQRIIGGLINDGQSRQHQFLTDIETEVEKAYGELGGKPPANLMSLVKVGKSELYAGKVASIYMITEGGKQNTKWGKVLMARNQEVTPEVIRDAKAYIESNPELLAYVNVVKKIMAFIQPKLNEVSMKVRGKEMGNLGAWYLPFIAENFADGEKDWQDLLSGLYDPAMLTGGAIKGVKQPAQVKSRKDIENIEDETLRRAELQKLGRLNLDIEQIVGRYIESSANYIGKAENIKHALQVLNNPDLVNSYSQKFGDDPWLDALKKQVTSELFPSGRMTVMGSGERALAEIRSRATLAMLGYRITSIATQTLSLPTGWSMFATRPKDIVRSLGVLRRGLTHPHEAGSLAKPFQREPLKGMPEYDEMIKDWPDIRYRSFDPDYKDMQNRGGMWSVMGDGPMAKPAKGAFQKFFKHALDGMKYTDMVIFTSIYSSAKKHQLELLEGKVARGEMTDEQANKEAADFARQAVDKTQNPSNMSQRSLMQKESEWMKALNPFSGQRFINFNLYAFDVLYPIIQAVSEAKGIGNVGAVFKGLYDHKRQLAFAWAVPALMMGMIYRRRPPEDDDEVLTDLLVYQFSSMPVIGQVLQAMKTGEYKTYAYDPTIVGNLYRAVINTAEAILKLNDPKAKFTVKDANDARKVVSILTRSPDYVNQVIQNFATETFTDEWSKDSFIKIMNLRVAPTKNPGLSAGDWKDVQKLMEE